MKKRTPFLLSLLLILISCQKQSTVQKEIISTEYAPAAIGPYSQAVQAGNTVYVSGQIPLDPATGLIVEGGIAEQTERSLENIKTILHEAGLEMKDVVQVQIFLSDLDNYKAMNEVYARYFTEGFPARAVVEAARIPKDVMIEIMAVAVKQN